MKEILTVFLSLSLLVGTPEIVEYPPQDTTQIAQELGLTSKNDVERVQKFYRRYKAPLENSAYEIVANCKEYGVDYRWLVAVSMVESTGGKKLFRKYNAWGWKTKKEFSSWEQSTKAWCKFFSEKYNTKLENNPQNIHKIAPIYNPDTPDDWKRKVIKFYSEI